MGILNPWAQYLREILDLMALRTWKRGQKRNRLCFSLPTIPLHVSFLLLMTITQT